MMDKTHMIHERALLIEILSNIANELCNCPAEGSINRDKHAPSCRYGVLANGGSDWTYILYDDNGPVAETLPPDNGRFVLLTIHTEGINDFDEEYSEDEVIKARYWYNVDDSAGWYDEYLDEIEIDLPDQTVKAVAWEPWPNPAPYPEKVNQ